MGILRLTANGLMGFVMYIAIVAGIYGVEDVLGGRPESVATAPKKLDFFPGFGAGGTVYQGGEKLVSDGL